jgi:hypothetical protein
LRGSPGPIRAKPRSGERDQDHGTRNWRPIGCNVPVGLIEAREGPRAHWAEAGGAIPVSAWSFAIAPPQTPPDNRQARGRTVTGSEVSSARDPLSPSPRCIRILINYVAGKR